MVGGGASKRGRWEGLRGGASKRGRWEGLRGGASKRGRWEGLRGGASKRGRWEGLRGGASKRGRWEGLRGGASKRGRGEGLRGGASKGGRWEGLRGGASKRGREEGLRGGVRRRGGAFDHFFIGEGQISSSQSRISVNGSSENNRDFWISAFSNGSSEGEPWDGTQSWRSATNPPFQMAPTEIAPMSVHGSLDEEAESSHNLVNMEGYRVKPDVAPLLGHIFAKYGDIAWDSNLRSLEARSWFLEMVCSIVQKLQSFKPISSPEMTRMLGNIRDMEKVRFNVGWLHKMLEDEKMVSDHPSLKAQKGKIEAKKQQLESLRKEIPRIKQELREMTEDYKECKRRRIRIHQEFGI